MKNASYFRSFIHELASVYTGPEKPVLNSCERALEAGEQCNTLNGLLQPVVGSSYRDRSCDHKCHTFPTAVFIKNLALRFPRQGRGERGETASRVVFLLSLVRFAPRYETGPPCAITRCSDVVGLGGQMVERKVLAGTPRDPASEGFT